LNFYNLWFWISHKTRFEVRTERIRTPAVKIEAVMESIIKGALLLDGRAFVDPE
jgi:hypothetical protein